MLRRGESDHRWFRTTTGYGFRVNGEWFMVQGSGLRVHGSGLMVNGSWFRIIVFFASEAAEPSAGLNPTKDETFVLLRGRVRVTTHNDDGSIIKDITLCPEEGKYGVNIPKGTELRRKEISDS